MALARQVIPDVVAGLMNPRRAWAGVCGEGSRAAMGKERAPVDRGAVVLRAIRSIRAAMAVWTELSADDRYEIEMAWHDMVADMPAELVGARVQAKGKAR
jgi:acyl-CoA reductase-like NAD-dependent aldehyde dehydrogenase